MRRSGDTTWFESPKGDGGGVAIDPDTPTRMACQYTNNTMRFSLVGGSGAEWQPFTVPVSTSVSVTGVTTFNEPVSFYTALTTSPPGASAANPMLLVYGTHRIWASPDWAVTWVTLPTGTTPAAAASAQDRLSPTNSALQAVVVATATRIYAANGDRVYRIDRTAAPVAATPAGVWGGPTQVATTGLPASPTIRALAVQSAAPESLFVGLGGSGQDHVWWYDQAAATWRPTGLSPTAPAAFDAPVTSLALDPGNPRHVYAGSAVGVWRGERAADGSATWTWANLSRALPEATVLDLDLATYGAGAGALRVLRAATFGRGLWSSTSGRRPPPIPTSTSA